MVKGNGTIESALKDIGNKAQTGYFKNINGWNTGEKMASINWEQLKSKIKIAAKESFIEIFDVHKNEGIYAFALYSDESAMTVCPAINTMLSLQQKGKDAVFKFDPTEWKYQGEGADKLFEDICTKVREVSDDLMKDDSAFVKFREQLYEACVDVLFELKQERFFQSIIGRDVFLVFAATDYSFNKKYIEKMVKHLNNEVYAQEYISWMKKWR